MSLLRRFWEKFHTAQMWFYRFMAPFSPLYFFFFFTLEKHIFVPLLFERERFYSSVQIAFLLPELTIQCPATRINGLLSREHEKGGTMAGTRQWHALLFFFIPITETDSGHHSRSLQNICQPLVATTWEYNWTLVSIRLRVSGLHSVTTRSSSVKSEPASLWR